MGMDVYGKAASAPEGEYFRNNVWWWRPLADYILIFGPKKITSKCSEWHSNSGDGLDKEDAKELAQELQAQLDQGLVAKYAIERERTLAAMADEPCEICSGTGKRAEPPNKGPGELVCNGCEGKGTKRPWATMYDFSEENVQEFVNFLRSSGGFEIN